MKPSEAWTTYIADSVDTPKWLESSQNISNSIKLSKRELVGLILYSYYLNKDRTINVCWDDENSEPNDGFLSMPNEGKIQCEHKIIPQFNKSEITGAIKETYTKYSKLGRAYGSNRHLIIHPNRQSRGMVRLSRLHYDIGKFCIFDKVFLAGVNEPEGRDVIRFLFSEQYPNIDIKHLRIKIKTGELLES